jgi:hypothetical protein
VEEDCSEDMMAVVRVWLLLLTMMVIAATVPIGDLGNSGLRWWDLDMGGPCWLVEVGVLRWERVGLEDAVGTGNWKDKEAGA